MTTFGDPRKVALISATTTPFTAEGELDLVGARRLFRHLDAHVDAVLLTGTMGEFPALTEAERLALYEVGLEVFGPARVIAHVGTESTRTSLRLARAAAGLGVGRLALITPYYLPATPDEVVAHVARVTEAVPAQWYGYLFPERTGVGLEPSELARVVEAAALSGFKISGAASARLVEYASACGPGVELYSGYDAGVPQAVADGAAGVISGFSSAFPRPFRALVDAIGRSDPAAVEVAQEAVLEIMAVMGNSIGAAKVTQSLSGLTGPHARMPVQFPAGTDPIGALLAKYR